MSQNIELDSQFRTVNSLDHQIRMNWFSQLGHASQNIEVILQYASYLKHNPCHLPRIVIKFMRLKTQPLINVVKFLSTNKTGILIFVMF